MERVQLGGDCAFIKFLRNVFDRRRADPQPDRLHAHVALSLLDVGVGMS